MGKIGGTVKAPQVDHSQSVVLVARYKDAEGSWRRHPVAYGKNGRVKPGAVMRGGKVVAVNSPVYEIRYYEGRMPKFMPAGRSAAEAESERKRIELQASAVRNAEAAGIKIEALPGQRKTIAGVFTDFIKDAEQRGAITAKEQAELVAGEFQKVTTKTFLDELRPDDILRYHIAMRKRGLSDRTVDNKHCRLRSMLRFGGIDTTNRNVFPVCPGYEKKLPTVYTGAQLKALLDAAEGRLRIGILLCLKLGLREGEATHAAFVDIDFSRGLFRVRSKPEWNHSIKDGEQRDVPIPADLLAELKAWRESRPEGKRNGLIAPTKYGKPQTKMLLALKRLAHKHELNCGHCEGCANRTKDGWGCHAITLHKLRRSYLTTLLRNGIDLRTVQALAGHTDLESTMRYLRPAESSELRGRIDSLRW